MMKVLQAACFSGYLLVSQEAVVVMGQINDGPWGNLGSPKVGTNSQKGIGEQVLFPDTNVIVEAHHVLPTKAKGWITPTSFEVSVYLYEDALYDWIPFGTPLKRDYQDLQEDYNGIISKIFMQPLSQSDKDVAVLETFMNADDDSDDLLAYDVKIQTYNFHGGMWWDSASLEAPEEMKNLEKYLWGTDMSLSRNRTIAVGIPSIDGGMIQLYMMKEDNFYPNTWEPFGPPLLGGTEDFGWMVEMSNDGDIVFGQGCIGFDDDDDIGVCYIRVFKYDAEAGSWVQLGKDIDLKDLKQRPDDGFAIDGESGYTVVVGSVDYDPNCEMSKMGGHVRVYAYDVDSGDWKPKGQDLDRLMDFTAAASYDFGYSLDIADDGNRVIASVYWYDAKLLGQQGFVQTFAFDRNNGQWVLDGVPVHSGPFNSAVLSPGDGARMVVGSEFDVMYLGSLQTFHYYTSSANSDDDGSDHHKSYNTSKGDSTASHIRSTSWKDEALDGGVTSSIPNHKNWKTKDVRRKMLHRIRDTRNNQNNQLLRGGRTN